MTTQRMQAGIDFEIIKFECENFFALYKYIRQEYKFTSILESLGEYDDETSRYSIIGVIAKQRLYGQRNHCILENYASNERKKGVNWLDILDDWTRIETCVNVDSPIQLGAIGYIGYENKYLFENLNKRIEVDHDVPDVYLINYSVLCVHDKKTNDSYWVVENGFDKSICSEIEQKYRLFYAKKWDFHVLGDIEPDFSKEEYIESITKNIEYIRNGDIFQANITVRFHGNYIGDTFVIYDYLRKNTPNPFFCFFDFDYPLISTSPERFIKIKKKEIYSNPIKGTITCTIDGEDQKVVLENSIKNNAENVMITDLIRNDLGRVCKQGTVDVLALCEVKKFNSIYHLESIVYGLLKDDIKMSNVFQATFPGGSISGAPKIRALDIIEEIENTARGPYCGITGFFGKNGWIDTSIAIRIIYFDKERFYYHAGGGIIVDSKPEDEYNELQLKGEQLKRALMNFNILREKRERLDDIDKALLKILHKRFSIIKEITHTKQHYNIPILQNSRVAEMLEERKSYLNFSELGLNDQFIDSLYELIIDYSMELERTKI